jgi:hypothetical protein
VIKPAGRTFNLVIALPRTNAIRALRDLLKRLLRTHGFRCVSCEEITQPPKPKEVKNGEREKART